MFNFLRRLLTGKESLLDKMLRLGKKTQQLSGNPTGQQLIKEFLRHDAQMLALETLMNLVELLNITDKDYISEVSDLMYEYKNELKQTFPDINFGRYPWYKYQQKKVSRN